MNNHEKRPVCLTIGGSDSCSGAGIQADLRVFEMLGVRGCSAITALTAQNPDMITRVEPVSLAQLDAELHVVFDYYDVVAVKTGMFFDVERIGLVSAVLHDRFQGVLVVDPVLVSSSGKPLLPQGAVLTLTTSILPMATLVTPNLDEAAVFLGEAVVDADLAASKLARQFGCAVLLKGGHAADETLVDVLIDTEGELHHFKHQRQSYTSSQLHGTGCRLASAVAANLAHKLPLKQSVQQAIDFLQGSLAS